MNMFKQIFANPIVQQGLKQATKKSKYSVSSLSFLHASSLNDAHVRSAEQEVAIALGSNVGDRIHNFDEALRMMKEMGIHIKRYGCLYESAPAYVTDQPLFLNSAVRGTTKLGPHELLKSLKKIEKELGRTGGIRYGPRPIDLDILFYGKYTINSEDLTIPHQRIFERPFVMAPLIDLLGSSVDNDIVATWHSFSRSRDGLFRVWELLGGESIIGKESLKRVLPVGKKMWEWSDKSLVMGVLNLTPDSFSDGGKFQSVEDAISQVKLLISDGADIIDIGAQSTRPDASRLSMNEELRRLLPVLEEVVRLPELNGKLLSIDTFYSDIASIAVNKGAHIVNDVSGGRLDPHMLEVVSSLKVPYITMHMRGDPSTMQNSENLSYADVCEEVADELYERVNEAVVSGIPAWRIILDPGIGFSKKREHNLDILMGLPHIKRKLGSTYHGASHFPIIIGPSRKKFLGEICNHIDPVDRDPATVAAVTAGILGGANIIRVHNVGNGSDAVKVCDALLKRMRT